MTANDLAGLICVGVIAAVLILLGVYVAVRAYAEAHPCCVFCGRRSGKVLWHSYYYHYSCYINTVLEPNLDSKEQCRWIERIAKKREKDGHEKRAHQNRFLNIREQIIKNENIERML